MGRLDYSVAVELLDIKVPLSGNGTSGLFSGNGTSGLFSGNGTTRLLSGNGTTRLLSGSGASRHANYLATWLRLQSLGTSNH